MEPVTNTHTPAYSISFLKQIPTSTCKNESKESGCEPILFELQNEVNVQYDIKDQDCSAQLSLQTML